MSWVVTPKIVDINMIKQKIITGNNKYDFTKEVQKYLDLGWRVVPQTAAVSTTSTDSGESNFHAPIVSERWMIVLEII